MERPSDPRHRGLFGSGIAAWLVLFICAFIPEWTRNGDNHCGVFFCCQHNYGNCSVTETGVVSDLIPWVLSSVMLGLVSICAALCRCTGIVAMNVRQMAVTHIITGILILSGTTQFFILKFTRQNEKLNIGGAGVVSHITGWMFFISGCTGFCHGYNYIEHNRIVMSPYPPAPAYLNQPYAVNPGMAQMDGTLYRQNGAPGPSQRQYPSDVESGDYSSNRGSSSGKLSKIRNNIDYLARKFWKDY